MRNTIFTGVIIFLYGCSSFTQIVDLNVDDAGANPDNSLSNNKIFTALDKNLNEAISSSNTPPSVYKILITKDDIESLIDYAGSLEPYVLMENDTGYKEFSTTYLKEYYSGKSGYRDREGFIYKKPEIKDKVVGNDAIIPIFSIILEAYFDDKFRELKPFKSADGKTWKTKDGKEPTYCKVVRNETCFQKISKDGISEKELKAMRYITGFMGDKSKLASSLIVRSFGAIELQFVIGGKWSIGDNDTYAKIVETLVEITSKRLSEHYVYNKLSERTIQMYDSCDGDSNQCEQQIVRFALSK